MKCHLIPFRMSTIKKTKASIGDAAETLERMCAAAGTGHAAATVDNSMALAQKVTHRIMIQQFHLWVDT